MNKKKITLIIILLILLIIIPIIVFIISLFENKPIEMNNDNTNLIQNEDVADTNIDNNNILVNNSRDNINIEENSNFNMPILGGKLNEEGITLNGKPIVYNQKLSSKLNIAYMLKYDIKHNVPVSSFEIEMDKYIYDNKPKGTGLWIENQELFEETPLGTERFVSILSQVGVECNIDSNGFVEKIDNTIDICKNINKIVNSKKLVMIAFSPDYYAYIENYNQEANMTDTEDNYVSFEPIDNVYPYIITGKCEIEELQAILEQIATDIQ